MAWRKNIFNLPSSVSAASVVVSISESDEFSASESDHARESMRINLQLIVCTRISRLDY